MLVEETEFGSRVQDVGSVAGSLCTASETLDKMTISEPQLPQVWNTTTLLILKACCED